MSHTTQHSNAAAALKINARAAWELRYWSRHFGCTDEELREAIDAAGTTSVPEVKEQLGLRQ
jgi:hypothetical protein